MPRKTTTDAGQAVASAAELCLGSPAPCILFAGPCLVPVAASRAYGEFDLGPLRDRAEWPRLAAALQRVVVSGVPTEIEIGSQPYPDCIVRLHCAPVLGGGRVAGVLVWLNGPRAAAAEVRRAAEQTLAAKSRFLAAASHDLRQPFQAMRFFHSILAGRAVDDEARQAADMLGKALTSGEQLLNALLDISTLDAGTVEPRLAEFDLGELLGRVAAEFRPEAQARSLRLRVRQTAMRVHSDPVLVERILRNLLANAVRYTRTGGVLLGARRRGATARVEVWDTGFGIPEDQRAAIFEEFHQLENPGRDKSQGLGLGLAIVRRLACLLGLPVELRSRLGRGSVFSVTIPRVDTTTGEGGEATAEAPMDMTKQTVLVVEDDGMVLMGLTMILETWGLNVLAAEDMGQVLEKLDQGRPELILSDLRLGAGLSGFDVVERVRTMLGDHVPAVILTGETGSEQLEEGRRRNLTFLHKPIQPDALKQAIGAALPQA